MVKYFYEIVKKRESSCWECIKLIRVRKRNFESIFLRKKVLVVRNLEKRRKGKGFVGRLLPSSEVLSHVFSFFESSSSVLGKKSIPLLTLQLHN